METGAKWFVIGVTLSNMPAFLPPWSDVSTGMPNNWGAGCVTAALLEGLAGIEDTGAGLRSARISPRWLAAGVNEAQVSVRYPASRGYVLYHYRQTGKTISLDYSSCADQVVVRMQLPAGGRVISGLLDGRSLELRMETVDTSIYATVQVGGRGPHRLEIELT
jgi:hypothetical protein